jgi:hypothetical protein
LKSTSIIGAANRKIFKKEKCRKRFAARVRRSFSLKAKISEKKALFLFALKRKKWVFSLCSHASETLQKAKII